MGNPLFILFISCMVYISAIFLRLFPAVLAPDIAVDLSVTISQVGIFSGATILAYGLMQLPSGILADTIGPKKTIILLTSIAGICTLIFAFSNNVTVMTASRFLTGIGVAVSVPLMTLAAQSFPSSMYSRATSILLSSSAIGGIIATAPLLALSNAITWRYALAIFGVIALLMAVLTAVAVPNVSKTVQLEPKKTVSSKQILSDIFEILKTKSFWPITIWLMCCIGTYFALFSFWWGPYFIEAHGLTNEEMGIVLLFVSLISVFLPLLGAVLSDVVFKARKKPLMIFTSIGVLGTIIMCFSTGKISTPIIIAQILFVQLGFGCAPPLIYTMLKETFPLRLIGTATGCMNMFHPIWASIMQVVFGIMLSSKLSAGESAVDAYTFAYYLVIANVLVGLAMCFLMKETYTKEA